MPAQLSVFTLYNDTAAAVAWLVNALGFDVVNRWDDDSGAPIHAELKLDDAIVIVERTGDHGMGQPEVRSARPRRAPVVGRQLPAGRELELTRRTEPALPRMPRIGQQVLAPTPSAAP